MFLTHIVLHHTNFLIARIDSYGDLIIDHFPNHTHEYNNIITPDVQSFKNTRTSFNEVLYGVS